MSLDPSPAPSLPEMVQADLEALRVSIAGLEESLRQPDLENQARCAAEQELTALRCQLAQVETACRPAVLGRPSS